MNNDALQAILAEQMDLLRRKKIDPRHVNAMVNAAGKILSSVKLELEYARLCGVRPNVPFIRTHKKLAAATAKKPTKEPL